MSETCGAYVKRVPVPIDGNLLVAQAHAYLQECGRPVERDGLCATHVRKQMTDSRPLLRLLRRIGRW